MPGCNERANELNARYWEAVSHCNIAGRPRSGPIEELKCSGRAAFRHEMNFLKENEDQLRSQSLLSELQRGERSDFWKEIKALNPNKESFPLRVGGTLGRTILQTYGKIIPVQLQILLAPLTTRIVS